MPPAKNSNAVTRVIASVVPTWKKIKTEELKAEDVIIVVMGPTGAGKSSFISKAIEKDVGIIGHNLQSETSEVDVYRISAPGLVDGDIILVDTPGFDDTRRSDLEILQTVSSWLNSTYANNILLSGILYLHRITDNRMAGTPLRNLRSFENLVGKKSLENIILVSTMWDEVEEHVGVTREADLMNNYWNYMLGKGSRVARFKGNKESAFGLMKPLLDDANRKHAVRLQEEMVKLKRRLEETSVGQALFSKLEFVLKERQDAAAKLREAVQRGDSDLDRLQADLTAAQERLEGVMNDLQALRLPMLKRMITNVRAWLAR